MVVPDLLDHLRASFDPGEDDLGFDQLFDATAPDFTPYYARLAGQAPHEPGTVLPTDRLAKKGGGGASPRGAS
mgnify:CR=1 FL=1